MAGLYFDEFSKGQTFNHEIRRTMLDSDNTLFSALTYNPAAIHIDHEYSKGTDFGKPLMNSVLTLGVLIGVSVQDTTLGTTIGNLGFGEISYPAPVFSGDTLRAESTVTSLRESKSKPDRGIVIFEHRAYNQNNQLVCSCIRKALMMKKPA